MILFSSTASLKKKIENTILWEGIPGLTQFEVVVSRSFEEFIIMLEFRTNSYKVRRGLEVDGFTSYKELIKDILLIIAVENYLRPPVASFEDFNSLGQENHDTGIQEIDALNKLCNEADDMLKDNIKLNIILEA